MQNRSLAEDSILFVCICNKVNEDQISEAVRQGHDSLDKLEASLGVGNCCGKCKFRANRVIRESLADCQFVDATAGSVAGG